MSAISTNMLSIYPYALMTRSSGGGRGAALAPAGGAVAIDGEGSDQSDASSTHLPESASGANGVDTIDFSAAANQQVNAINDRDAQNRKKRNRPPAKTQKGISPTIDIVA